MEGTRQWGGIGLEQEDRVMLCLLDTIDFPTAFLGSIQAGVVPIAACFAAMAAYLPVAVVRARARRRRARLR